MIQYVSSSYSSIGDEIWSLIKHYSEVKKNGTGLAAKNGIAGVATQERAWRRLQANIRQAESYYEIARNTHTRSASLLYYYSFLNLVKGGLAIKRAQPFLSAKPSHGLYFNSNPSGKFSSLTLKVTGGVFKEFYTDYFGSPPSLQPLNIARLLSYCTDITVQLEMTNYGKSKTHAFLFAELHNGSDLQSWGLAAIHNYAQLKPYMKSFRNFNQNYQQVDMPNQEAKEVFGLNAWSKTNFTFFQEKNTHAWHGNDIPYSHHLLNTQLIGMLPNLLKPNLFEQDPPNYIIEPYSVNNQVILDEACSIYMAMFALSNLVRYNPVYLEKLLDSADSWIIENFIKYTPETFLRIIVGWLIDCDYVFMKR